MMIESLIDRIVEKPKKLFLIDGLGALVSIMMLGLVLPLLGEWIGIPHKSLLFLASIPVFFLLYDIICYLKLERDFSKYILIIAYLNLSYCLISVATAWTHWDVIKPLGWTYLCSEILILLVMIFIEIKCAKRLSLAS